jgi:hypothetical protein
MTAGSGKRADAQRAVVAANVAEVARQTIDVDEHAGLGESEPHQRNETVAAGQDLHIARLAQQS